MKLNIFGESNPKCNFYSKHVFAKEWEKHECTETVKNCKDPVWKKAFKTKLDFRNITQLHFKLKDVDLFSYDQIGSVYTDVFEIYSRQTLRQEIEYKGKEDRGTLFVQAYT